MNINKVSSMGGLPLIKVAALIIILAGVIYAKTIITPFLLALFISIICEQPISWLEKKGLPRWLALIIVLLGLISLLFGFTLLIGGTISSFSSNVSKYEANLTKIINSSILFLNDHGINIPKDQISTLVQPAKILEFTAGLLNGLFKVVGNTFLVYLIILFILMEFKSFAVKAKVILSDSNETVSYLSTITQNIRHYLWIKTLISLSIGILIYFALLLIGIDYALLWALIACLMNYIPNIGSIIAAIPAVLFALAQFGLGSALWTLGAFMVIHNVLGNFVEPKILGKGLGLSTLVVFLSLIFWGFVFGAIGMLLSVPITMSIKIILEHNEKSRWLAVLMGAPAEAKIYLRKMELVKKQHLKK
jgi:predicted PurR-regulated permease PerM